MSAPFACPCCGFLTLSERPPGTFAVCPVCYWEDDDVQERDPTSRGGANKVSLNEARDNFAKMGAADPDHANLVRPPTADEKPA